MNKSKLFFILRIFVSLGLLALLLWLARENFAKIIQLLKSVNIPIFILAFLAFVFSVFFIAWRLKIILKPQGTFLSLWELFPLTLIGYFFTNFMPTSVGGDIVKGYYISKKNKKRLSAYTSVLIDRLMGMFSVVLIASIALVIMRKNIEQRFIIWAIVLLLFCCAAFILSLFHKKFLKKIARVTGIMRLLQALKLEFPFKKVYQTLRAYAKYKKVIVKVLALSMLAQFIGFFSVSLLAKSLSLYISFGKIVLAMPIIIVLCMLPITMNGLGLREWAFVFFFSTNVGEAAAFSLSLLYLAMFLLTSLFGGVIYLFWR